MIASTITPGLVFDPEPHTYLLMGSRIPSVTQILDDMGFTDTTWFTEESRVRGSAVHHATHLVDEGRLNRATVDFRILGHLRAWERFSADFGFEPIYIEETLASRRLICAGTLDRFGIVTLGEYSDLTVEIDLKSGQHDPAHEIQVAAYDMMLTENQIGTPDAHLLLYLRADGTYDPHWINKGTIIRLRAAWQGLCIGYHHCDLLRRRIRKEEYERSRI